MRFIQLRSAPAQNAGPLPASTTARTELSRSSAVNVCVSFAMSASSNALRTSGRLSVTRPTPPLRSTVINGRLHDDFALDRVRDVALPVRLMVQRAVIFVAWRPAGEGHLRPQRDLRHPSAVEQADRFVDIAVDGELRLQREMQEPQHVALRHGGDECLLRIDAGS